MPSCPPPAPSEPDDSHIQAAASQLTESTLKRALAHLITEAIDVEASREPPPTQNCHADDGVEETARALVSTVLRDSWTAFLDACDLEQWLAEGRNAPLSHRMARDLLRQVADDGERDAAGGGRSGARRGQAQDGKPGGSREAVDLGFFQSPREHTNTDTLYPKSGGADGPADGAGASGQRQAAGGRRAEAGAAGGDAGADGALGEEVRFRFDNSDCRIDLRLVRPYDGVLTRANSIDKEGNEVAVLLFDSSQLPARSAADYDHLMQQLLLYCMYMVEQHMYSNYSIVYLHGNAAKDHWPRAKWLRQWCHSLNSKTSKHLTQIFVVYPTLWIRTLRLISRPFVKFKPSVHFLASAKSLVGHLPEVEAILPRAVKESEGL